MEIISPLALQEYTKTNFSDFFTMPISIDDIVFEKRNELLCFYCSRYNNKWTCPPRIPKLDYREVFNEYDYALLVGVRMDINDDYEMTRNDSSLQLHRTLLKLEEYLLQHGNAVRVSFIGGSCKLCKNGCAPDRCRNPYLARIPLEATGVNVIETTKRAGISLEFPATDSMMRIGMILW